MKLIVVYPDGRPLWAGECETAPRKGDELLIDIVHTVKLVRHLPHKNEVHVQVTND